MNSKVVVLLNMLLLKRLSEPSELFTTSTLYLGQWALFKSDMLMVKGNAMGLLSTSCLSHHSISKLLRRRLKRFLRRMVMWKMSTL